jgi:hypothetical protein
LGSAYGRLLLGVLGIPSRTIESDMSEQDDYLREPPDRSSNKLTPIMAAGLVAFISTIVAGVIFATGGRVVTGGETSAAIVAQLQIFAKQNDDQNRVLSEQSKDLHDVMVKLGSLVTRDEWQRYQETNARRFDNLEARISDLARQSVDVGPRLNAIESTQRMQQIFIEKLAQPSRRP